MLRFLAAQRDTSRGKLGKAIAMTQRNLHAGPNQDVAVGLASHLRAVNGRTVVFHSGETGGFHGYMGFSPSTGTNAVLLANSTGAIDEIGLELIDKTQLLREEMVEPVIARSLLESYVGKYEVRPGVALDLRTGDEYEWAPRIPK